jgi:hypothetical protein
LNIFCLIFIDFKKAVDYTAINPLLNQHQFDGKVLIKRGIYNSSGCLLLYNKSLAMKNETRRNFESAKKLSVSLLKELESSGFQYVQVKGYTMEKQAEYVEPHYFMLVPIRELPSDQEMKDIYEPISSEFLMQWAAETQENSTEVLVAIQSAKRKSA